MLRCSKLIVKEQEEKEAVSSISEMVQHVNDLESEVAGEAEWPMKNEWITQAAAGNEIIQTAYRLEKWEHALYQIELLRYSQALQIHNGSHSLKF